MAIGAATRQGHPPGTYLLCFTEMLERFSYYTMSGLLVLFLAGSPTVGGFGWPKPLAIEVFGIYVAILWLMPLPGGWIGDNWLGARRAAIVGGLLVAAGQALMLSPAVVPGLVTSATCVPVGPALVAAGVPLGMPFADAATRQALATSLGAILGHSPAATEMSALLLAYRLPGFAFAAGLVLLAVGNGLLKPNITVMLGDIYRHQDPRRDEAFTLFYIGINLGAVASALLAGTVAERLGWAFGFGIASVMVLAGTLALVVLGHLLPAHVGRRRATSLAGSGPVRREPLPRGPLLHVVVMMLFAAVFWGAFMQTFGLLSLFAYADVDRAAGDFIVPAAWFGSLTPFFLIGVGPLFQWGINALGRRGILLDTQKRFIIGFFIAALAFVMLATAIAVQPHGGKTPMVWLAMFYLILAVGELSLSPAGNAMIGRLGSPAVAGRLMAIWFLCYGLGSLLSAGFGGLAQVMSIPAVLACLAITLFAAALLMALFRRPIQRLAGLVPVETLL
jgi:proton-dependent oligopeptide transporter, POT family